MACTVTHTNFQPSDDEWKCPKCGADSNAGFVINESPSGVDPLCELLHTDDEVACYACDKAWSGSSIARVLYKRSLRVPCPHCKGTGCVPKARKT